MLFQIISQKDSLRYYLLTLLFIYINASNSITDIYFLVIYRYKDDVYDRIWLPYESSNDWARLNTSLNNDDLVQDRYKPAAIVMSTAVTSLNASAPLQFHWDADNENDQYYSYLLFNEVEKLAENETRAFIITVNRDLLYGPLIPKYQKVTTVYCRKPSTRAKRYQISLSKTENSTLPPILNAFEIYKVKEFSRSETQQEDGMLALNFLVSFAV